MIDNRGHADVCLIVEGAYPYLVGGVSNWLQDLIISLPDIRFSIVAIKASDTPQPWRITPPPNVIEVLEVPLTVAPVQPRRYPSHQMDNIGHLLFAFLSDGRKSALLALTAELATLKPRPQVGDILSSPEMFEIFTRYFDAVYPSASFHHFFWAMRTLLGGLLAILLTPLPVASVYHTVSTGFAGLLAARAVYETGRPAFVTEHGIYLLEREIEVMMADWIGDQIDTGLALDGDNHDLRDLWLTAFQSYTRACYDACDPIIALYSANSDTQKRLGAPPHRLMAIPNGIDPARFEHMKNMRDPERPMVSLIGRVVPIKDIKTYIRAAALVVAELPNVQFTVLGPQDEDRDYAAECSALVTELGLDSVFKFTGRVRLEEWMSRIDLLVLTSLSEAQPLVILEGGVCGIPVVAPDVGSCRELIEGRAAGDRPGGIVTALVDPQATATAILKLLRDPGLRATMGTALRERILRDYDYPSIVNKYRNIYEILAAKPDVSAETMFVGDPLVSENTGLFSVN